MTQKPELPKPQIDRFKQTARELGCDEDEAAFDEKLKSLAKQRDAQRDQTVNRESPKKCLRCRGTGTISQQSHWPGPGKDKLDAEEMLEHLNDPGTRSIPCPVCKGTGKKVTI